MDSVSLPNGTPFDVYVNDGSERLFVLCPDIHFLEAHAPRPHVRHLHEVMLQELDALVDQLDVRTIVQEGFKMSYAEQAKWAVDNGWSLEVLEAQVEKGALTPEKAELYWAFLSDAPLEERRARLVARLAGKWNTPDALEGIYFVDRVCFSGENEAPCVVRQELNQKLDDILVAVSEDRSLQAIVAAHLPELDSRKFSGKAFSDFLSWAASKPAAKDAKKHRKFRSSYDDFRQAVIQLESRAHHLTYEVTHDELLSRLEDAESPVLITFGAYHIDDLRERLAALGTVVVLHMQEHVPEAFRGAYSQDKSWADRLPPLSE